MVGRVDVNDELKTEGSRGRRGWGSSRESGRGGGSKGVR